MKADKKIKNSSRFNFTKYIPIFVILLSVTIIVGSTFAYFTDTKQEESDLTFSLVELSSETTTGINGVIYDALPGTKLINGEVAFAKSIDSEPIYVRAKISYSLPSGASEGMEEVLKALRAADGYNIEADLPNGAKWSAKDGNYFYLLNSSDGMMVVESIDKYVLTKEMVIPRDLEQLEGNAQYMESVNFHIAFEAIQSDNVTSDVSEIKKIFNNLFPESEAEKFNSTPTVVINGVGGFKEQMQVEVGTKVVDIPYPVTSNSGVFAGWYKDEELTIKFTSSDVISEDTQLFAKVVEVESPALFTFSGGTIVGYSGEATDIVLPTSYSIVGQKDGSVSYEDYYELRMALDDGMYEFPVTYTDSDGRSATFATYEAYTSKRYRLSSLTYPVSIACKVDVYGVGDDYKITSIASSAFKGNTAITSVILGEDIVTIGSSAFNGCSNLESINLENIEVFGDSAFNGCSSLLEVNLKSVTKLGHYLFKGCRSLTAFEIPASMVGNFGYDAQNVIRDCVNLQSLTVEEGNPRYYSENNCIIEKDTKTLILGCHISQVPDGIEIIGDFAFSGATFKEFEIPEGVKHIGEYVFNESALESVCLPSSLTTIEYGAFRDSLNLSEIDIKSSAVELSSAIFANTAFYNDTANWTNDILYITYSDSGEKMLYRAKTTLTSISSSAFSNVSVIVGGAFNSSKIKSMTIPYGVKYIGYNAFSSSDLASISLPNSLIAIYGGAFNVTDITTITLPSSLRVLGDTAFSSCYSLGNITLPEGLEYIGKGIFSGCDNVTRINIPSTVKHIKEGLLTDNINVTTITVASSNPYYKMENNCLIEIETNTLLAFTGSGSSVNIPSYVTRIGAYAFYERSITSIDLSNITYIGADAFAYCKSLASITIPSGVSEIGNYAFYVCEGLSEIVIPENIKVIGSGAFNFCKNVTAIYIDSEEVAKGFSAEDSQGYLLRYVSGVYVKTSISDVGEFVSKVDDTIYNHGGNEYYLYNKV